MSWRSLYSMCWQNLRTTCKEAMEAWNEKSEYMVARENRLGLNH
jgi:hypothetical protein